MHAPNEQMQMILDAHKEMGPLPIESLTPDLARLIPLPDRAAVAVYGHHLMKKAFTPFPVPVGNVEHAVLKTPSGNLLARIYTPKGTAPDGGWPVLIYFHGGGFVIATLDTYDSSCRALCDGAKCVVVSLHYRQAPEHPWPAAAEDAYAGYSWAHINAGELGWNFELIAVGGESAGGNLAAIVCLMARDRNEVAPVHQLLIYPVTDFVHGSQSPSAIENAQAQPLNQAMLDWFYGYYLGETDRTQAYVSPLHASSHAGLPPATVILAQIDPLRSDGEAYAAKLAAAGVPTKIKIYEGVTHEFFGLAGLVNESTEAVAFACKELRKSWDAPRMVAVA
jgi:acetyl esterase